MKIYATFFIAFLFLSSVVYADVIRLQDGKIFLGRLLSADSEGITIESAGEKKSFSQSDILKNEKDLSTLKGQYSEISLKDGSTIKGKIENYDEDVGLLVNIGFGSVTLPMQSIGEITDPVQRKFYSGSPVQVGISGGYYMPAGSLKKNFNPGFNAAFFAEFRSNMLQGLFFGADLSYFPADYKSSTDVNYNIFTLQLYASYRLLMLKRKSSFIKNITPFVSLGIGPAYILLKDNRGNSLNSEKSEMDLSFSLKAGTDFRITESVSARIYAGWHSVLQKSDSFSSLLINAGALYSF